MITLRQAQKNVINVWMREHKQYDFRQQHNWKTNTNKKATQKETQGICNHNNVWKKEKKLRGGGGRNQKDTTGKTKHNIENDKIKRNVETYQQKTKHDAEIYQNKIKRNTEIYQNKTKHNAEIYQNKIFSSISKSVGGAPRWTKGGQKTFTSSLHSGLDTSRSGSMNALVDASLVLWCS